MTKLPFLQIKLALAISLASLSFTPVQAMPVNPVIFVQRPSLNSSRQLNKPLIFNAPEPPDDINAPGGRTGGGKRGCENIGKQLTGSKEKRITALVPVYGSPDSELVLGLTITSHPTFWFYVPYSRTLSAEFVLQDEAERTVYQTPVSLSGTPGVVSPGISPTLGSRKYPRRTHFHLNGRKTLIRSKNPRAVVQEIYGWLLAHWAVRCLMFQAAEQAEISPLRLGFTGSLRVVRRAVAKFQDAQPQEIPLF